MRTIPFAWMRCAQPSSGARLVFAVRYLLHGSHSLRSGYERSSRWVRLCAPLTFSFSIKNAKANLELNHLPPALPSVKYGCA
jgi:hypothetical protein